MKKIASILCIAFIACIAFAKPKANDQVELEKLEASEVTEKTLADSGYKRIKIAGDVTDYIKIENTTDNTCTVEIWAVDKHKRVGYCGTIEVEPGKWGYKGNPLDESPNHYYSIYMKITDDTKAKIVVKGENFSDQYILIK